jgi:DNA-binding transcriptional ArsR family regulator
MPAPRTATTATDPDAPALHLSATEVLELLGDPYVRELLQATADRARTARDLVERSSGSRSTVYRRLDRLEEAGLVATDLRYDVDGHHRTTYRATLDEVTLSVDRDGLAAALSVSADAGDDLPVSVP